MVVFSFLRIFGSVIYPWKNKKAEWDDISKVGWYIGNTVSKKSRQHTYFEVLLSGA